MNTENNEQDYTVNCVCAFCDNRWQMDDFPYDTDKVIKMPSCARCFPKIRPGAKVRYGAPGRAPADAVYADLHLQRGHVYTISKVKRWQHGSYVWFKETGDHRQFNASLFTPPDFNDLKVWKVSDCDWYAAETYEEAANCAIDDGLDREVVFQHGKTLRPLPLAEDELRAMTIADPDVVGDGEPISGWDHLMFLRSTGRSAVFFAATEY